MKKKFISKAAAFRTAAGSSGGCKAAESSGGYKATESSCGCKATGSFNRTLLRKNAAALAVIVLMAAGCSSSNNSRNSSAAGAVNETAGQAAYQTDNNINNNKDNNKESLPDGQYSCQVTLSGGSGKAGVSSPAQVTIEGGKITAKLVWSSSHYDYMLVDGERYENQAESGEASTFLIPVSAFNEEISVVADTTAMSQPHEIDYKLYFYAPGQEAAGTESEDSSENGVTLQEAGTDEAVSGAVTGQTSNQTADQDSDQASGQSSDQDTDHPDIAGLTFSGEMELSYADQYSVSWYSAGDSESRAKEKSGAGDSGNSTGDKNSAADSENSEEYAYIRIGSGNSADYFLLVPEGAFVPENLDSEITVLQQPLDKTYLVSTSSMDMVRAAGALDQIRLCGTKESDWYIEEAKEAMESGSMLYAGKYSAPDYELLLSQGCNFAIENTMIYHNPDVREKLISLGIPVMVEHSSYESDPLGRLEWVRLYGVLYGKREEADAFFNKAIDEISPLLNEENTGKSVAFFSITSNGSVTVRKPGDYISCLIGMAGGSYAFDSLPGEDDNSLSTMNMQMEDFYAGARDADILIYNSTIEGDLDSISGLTKKNSLLAEFKAVKEGNVYCLGPQCFQKSTMTAELLTDLYKILHDKEESDLCFLTRLE